MTSVSNGSKQSEEESLLNSEMQSAVSTVNYNEVTKDDNNDTDHGRDVSEDKKLAQLYQAAKDENELLEFKNYELLFKIQELEQNQKKILKKLVVADCNVPACNSDKQQPENKENEVKFEIVGHDSRLTSSKIKHDFNNHDPYLKVSCFRLFGWKERASFCNFCSFDLWNPMLDGLISVERHKPTRSIDI